MQRYGAALAQLLHYRHPHTRHKEHHNFEDDTWFILQVSGLGWLVGNECDSQLIVLPAVRRLSGLEFRKSW